MALSFPGQILIQRTFPQNTYIVHYLQNYIKLIEPITLRHEQHVVHSPILTIDVKIGVI